MKAPEEEGNSQDDDGKSPSEKKIRTGSEKRKKTANLPIHETKIIQPSGEIPPDAE